MKSSERKIKKCLPFDEVPAFLRCLADAIENKTDHLPPEWTDLPEPITKLAVKGKAREDLWEMKIRIKAASPNAELAAEPANEQDRPAPAPSGHPDVNYKDLKKRLKSSFKTVGQSLASRQLPNPATIDAFIEDSERMTAYSGAAYGEDHYPAYREACRQLVRACADRNWEACKAAYESLDRLKQDCHKAYK